VHLLLLPLGLLLQELLQLLCDNTLALLLGQKPRRCQPLRLLLPVRISLHTLAPVSCRCCSTVDKPSAWQQQPLVLGLLLVLQGVSCRG
jgi:hypothetical protein